MLELKRFPTTGVYGDIPGFNVESILTGKDWVLSIGEGDGEGDGDFISTLIRAMEKSGVSPRNVHAADYAYGPWDPSGASSMFHVKPYLTQYPENYHAALVQNLDLRNPDGSRMRFHEIVSSSSLNYVFKRSSREVIKSTLEGILDHLQPGGVLRFFSDTYLTPQEIHVLREIFEELRNEGKITNHNIRADENPELRSVVIQKVK
jgi:hypothetical protein